MSKSARLSNSFDFNSVKQSTPKSAKILNKSRSQKINDSYTEIFLSSQALTKDIISDLQVLKSLVNNVKEDWKAMSRIIPTSEHLANKEQRLMVDKPHRGLLTYLEGVDAIRKSITEKVTKIKKIRELVLMNAEMYSQDQLDGLQDVILSLQDLEYKFSKYREDCESVYKTLVDETGQCTALMSMTWFNVFWINDSISEINGFF